MVRVLHYVGRMNRGGMEMLIMNLYRKIDREKMQFDFAVHGDSAGDFEEEIINMGGSFYYFPHMRKNPRAYRKAWRSFWEENKNKYTAFHMHTNSLANIIALEEATRVGIPVRIVHSHSSMANKGRLQWINDTLHILHRKKLPCFATHLFACSDKAAEWLFGGNELGNLSVCQINNGVDTQKFKFDEQKRVELRNKLGIEDARVIGHVGTFVPVKNHTYIIDVVEQAYKKDSHIKCLLIGTGPLQEEIKELARHKGLEDIVLFMGSCENVHELLSAMDIFLMPSLYEGLPVSLVEVQTNGLPALVSDTITKDVYLRDNLHYFSLSEGAECWADKALSIMKNQIHMNGVECIVDGGFDITNTALLYENIILKGEKS